MGLQRTFHSAGFKAKVAPAAHRVDRTVTQLAGQYDVHPTQSPAWKKQLLAGAEAIFANGTRAASTDAEARETGPYEQVGRLKMELEWVKYEDVNLRGDEEVPELRRGLARYFTFDNRAWPHQALGYRTPAAVHAMPSACDLGLSPPASGG